MADLAGAIDALCELERQACEKAGEARDATAALHSLQSVNTANAEARAKAERESAAYREQRDSEGARAVAAERQLAEYRSLMAALPLGMARAYPAAFPLLRAYLADAEGRGPGKRDLSVDGCEFDSPDSPLDSAGEFPPFRVFDADAQDWLPGDYPTREAAERALAAMRAAGE